MKPTAEAVRNYLERNGSITGHEALRELGVYRLAARVQELRESGMRIETEYKTQAGKRFGVYRYRAGTPV
jgi:hypothetical protein